MLETGLKTELLIKKACNNEKRICKNVGDAFNLTKTCFKIVVKLSRFRA